MDSYRPVSIIPALSKVFENGLSSRLTEFLTSTDALSDRQYAYREGRSTTSVTREVIRLIVAARERKQHVALNLKKTHFIHFCLSGHTLRPLSVTVDGKAVEQVQSTAFLGFQIDRGLQWAKHIDVLCGRLGSACYALSRVSRVVSADVARACYFATVHSLLQYGTELWARAADWERAFRMQKRAIRAIVRIPSDESARPHFKALGILTLPCIVISQVAIYVRDNQASYTTHGDIAAYHLRDRHRLVPVSRTLKKSSMLTHIMGPAVYNKLPDSVIQAPNNTIFKFRLKRWLIEHTFYSYEKFINNSSA